METSDRLTHYGRPYSTLFQAVRKGWETGSGTWPDSIFLP